jgi:hypothetical protein
MMSMSMINRKPLKVVAILFALLCVSIAGCQNWWSRPNSQSLLGFANEGRSREDDWEHPSNPTDRDSKFAPAYQPPSINSRSSAKPEKPSRVTLPRDRQKDSLAKTPSPDLATLPTARTAPGNLAATSTTLPTVAAMAPASDPNPPMPPEDKSSSVVQASASETPAPKPDGIRDSGQADVDIEGALSALPSEYQSTLRKRITGETITESDNKAIEIDPKDPTRWTHELNQSVVALEKLLEASTDMEPALRMHHEMTLRVLYLAQRNLEAAKRPIPGASDKEQEYLEHQLSALYLATSPDPNPSRPRHWAQVASEQKLADRHLGALSNLQLSPPVFCTQVDGYGQARKFDKDCFTADQQVLLYCELDNVTSQKVREGFETKVRGTYEIRDAQGKRLVEQSLPMEPDISSSQRRDFFLVYMIYMPASIAPGKYELILTMEDLCGNKFGSSKTEFEIKK